MTDAFGSSTDSASAPSRLVTPIVPNDGADLAVIPKAIYVGTAGNVALIPVDAPAGAAAVIFKNVPAGSTLQVRPRRVLATGTTAADIVALTAAVASSASIPAPSFTQKPSISPGSGAAGGTTFEATDGIASNGNVTARRWLLSGTLIGTGSTVFPQSGGSLVLENTATGPDGRTITSTSAAVIIAEEQAPSLPVIPITKALTATPSTKSVAANAASGTLLFAIGNVPAGVTPTVSPNDGRFAIAGDATNGWKVVTGLSALSAGSVNVAVSAAGATGVAVPVTITAVASPNVSISGAQSKSEGNSGATIFTYTVTRSDTAGAVAVPWSFTPGNTSADDFTGGVYPAGATVPLADGQASGTFSVSVNGDTVVESDETFTVLISTPSGYVAGAATSATGTILNDDTASAPAYAARTTNAAQSTPTLASPVSDTFVASASSVLAGSATGAGTWVNLPLGTNPGAHNRQADGSGVAGNAAGRAGSYLSGVVSGDGEIGANLTINAAGNEGQAALLARVNASDTTAGTWYEANLSGSSVYLGRQTAGAYVSLGTYQLPSFALGTAYSLRLRTVDFVDPATGNTFTALRVFLNDVEGISVIDTAPLPAGVWGIRGGRNVRFKNLLIGAWQAQAAHVAAPNVYDASASGVVISPVTVSSPGATYALANDDGGRFALVDTGRKIYGRSQYNLVTAATQTKIADGSARAVTLRESKPNYADKDTVVPLGVVAPLTAKPVRFVSANAGDANSQVGGGQDAWHTYTLMPLGANADDIRPIFRAMAIGQDGKGYMPCSAASVSGCTVMIEGGRFRVPVTFGGAAGATIPATLTGILEADPVTPAMFGLTEWPRGGNLRVCAYGRVTGAAPCGMLADQFDSLSSFNCTYPSANEQSWIYDATKMPPNYSGKSAVASGVFLTAIVGKSNTDAVLAEGDSETYGAGDALSIIPTGGGWFGRMSAIGGIIPGYRACRSGISGSDYLGSGGDGRRAMIMKGYATIGIDFFGTNDLGTAGAGDVTAINAMHASVTADFKAAGMKVLRGQLMPRTVDVAIALTSITVNGTTATAVIADSASLSALKVGAGVQIAGAAPASYNAFWTIIAINTANNSFDFTVASGTASATTPGNFGTKWSNQLQTVLPEWGAGGKRDQINAKNVADVQSGAIDGVIDFTSAVCQPGNTTLWKYDGSTPYLTTGDGTHPSQAGHALMAAAARNAILTLAPALA